jgi:hypothetical protein
VVAEEGDLARASGEEIVELCEDRFPVYGVRSVGPEVMEEHGDKRDDEEGSINIVYEVGFGVGVVCEDSL